MFANDEDESVCPNCGSTDADVRDDGFECSDCYTNPDCPDGCNDEHDEPEPNYDGQWTCPTTGNVFTRDDGQWDRQGRYPMVSTYIDRADEWYVYPSDHGYIWCERCEEYRDEDDIHYDPHGDQRGCGYCSDGDYDEDYEVPSRSPVVCEACRAASAITHYHPVTEQVVCASCATDEHEAVPVLVAA